MNIRLLFSLAALALAFAVAGCGKPNKLNIASASIPAGPVELKLKWTPGEKIIQEFNMEQTMRMNLPGQPAPMKQHMTMGERLSLTVVKADPDGSHELEMQFVGAHVAMEMGKINMNYDSDKASADGSTNPLATVFTRLIGAKIQYFLDASNNVERIDGIDDLISRISAGDKSGIFKSIFTENYFKQIMAFNRFLPSNPVQPGDSWPVKLEVPMASMGAMGMNYKLTFKGWEMVGKRNCARIEMTGDIQSKSGAGAGPMGMTIAIPEGNLSGALWFDPELGATVSSKMNQDMTMLMSMPKRARPGLGATGPQTITNQLSQVIDFKVDSLE